MNVKNNSFRWLYLFLECLFDALYIIFDISLHDVKMLLKEIGRFHYLFMKLSQLKLERIVDTH